MEQLNSGLLFRLGEEWLIIDAMSTIEVAELRPIRRIPRRTDAVFLGMVNIRGELRLAFDLHQLLGIAPLQGADRQAGRFVVIRLDRQTWVFPTDEVSAIIRYQHSQETAVPQPLSDGNLLWSGRSSNGRRKRPGGSTRSSCWQGLTNTWANQGHTRGGGYLPNGDNQFNGDCSSCQTYFWNFSKKKPKST